MLIPPSVKGRRGVSVFRFIWSEKQGQSETATGYNRSIYSCWRVPWPVGPVTLGQKLTLVKFRRVLWPTFDSLGVLFFSSSSDTSDCSVLFSAVHCVFPLALLAISLSPLLHFPDSCSLLLALLSQRASRFFSHHFLILFFCLFFPFFASFVGHVSRRCSSHKTHPGREAFSRVESLRLLVFSFFLVFFSSSTSIPRDSYKLVAARILGIVPLRCCGFMHLKLLARRGGGQ